MNIIVKGKNVNLYLIQKYQAQKYIIVKSKMCFSSKVINVKKYADMCACNTQLMSPSTRQLGLFQMTHLSHQVINICAYVSTSAAVIGLLRLFFPSQPQGGAVDLGGPGLC